jgi:hypothetical protein
MYTIFLYNFGYELDRRFDSYTAALEKAIDIGFECVIRRNGEPIKTIKSY